MAPEGLLLKLKMSIDPDAAIITLDLTEMPDQLPWGYNLSQATSRGACILGSMPSLDPTLPRNDGVFRHFNILLREGAVAGIPRWPIGTSLATVSLCDEVSNMVFRIWEQVKPGLGHGSGGMINASASGTAGTDFRHGHAPYGHFYFLAEGGGPASRGCDGWPCWIDNATMGNTYVESVELNELKVPNLIWECRIQTDSGGAGKWRGGPATCHRIQPRHQTITAVPYAVGHTSAPLGVAGGKAGCLADHWIEKHTTRAKVRQLRNVGIFQISEDEDWVVLDNGGGGYGDPLERDPKAVREDARNYIVSIEAARDEYGVILDTKPELYKVDYEATRKLRAQLKKERRTK
jgi:N-methylhydantoinase B